MAFQARRIGDALWPQTAVVGGLLVLHMVSRLADAAMKRTEPFKRTQEYVHAVALGGATALVGFGKMSEIGRTAVLTEMALVGDTASDWLFGKLKTRLITRQVARNPGGQQLALAQGRSEPAMDYRTRQTADTGSISF